jgi:diguanylate cyclase (GGDEF)-like protein
LDVGRDIGEPIEFQSVLERILQEFQRPIDLNDGAAVTLGISIGVTTYPADNSSASELVEHADWAIYQTKKSVKNRIFIRS